MRRLRKRHEHLKKLYCDSCHLFKSTFQTQQKTYRNEMGEIDFKYADCDTYGVELSELYSYAEVEEFANHMNSFISYMKEKGLSPIWLSLEKREKQSVFADLVQRLEHTGLDERLEAARILLYILQGAFIDFEEPLSEVVADAMDEARSHIQAASKEDFMEQFCLLQAACNAYLAYDSGVFKALLSVLFIEANELTDENGPYVERSYSSLSNYRSSMDGIARDANGRKMLPIITENEMIRVTLAAIYHILEAVRRQDVLAQCAHVSDFSSSHLEHLQRLFIKELKEPLETVDKTLFMYLVDLIPPFIRGASAKIVLCTWKVLLATFGGINTIRELKNKRRAEHDLPPIEDTITIGMKMRPTNFSTDGQFSESTGTKVQRRYRGGIARGAFNRQQALVPSQLSDDASSPRDEKIPDADEIGLVVTAEDGPPILKSNDEKQSDSGRDTPAPGSSGNANQQNGGLRTPNGGEQTPTASTSPTVYVLPWTSKIKQSEVEQFIQNERIKFCGFKLPRDGVSTFGLPEPVQKSIEALKRHVYVSLGEKQIADEKIYRRFPFSQKEIYSDTLIEDTYMRMIPNLASNSICFLKILLASIPSTKFQSRSDCAHIFSDVLTARYTDATDLLCSSFNVEHCINSSHVLEDAVRLAIDVTRNKEIPRQSNNCPHY
ncbi:hypothetical protein M3Y97_01013600 [Aphelenchoides bicaudatus]|nr:hypothetical protein M3Y97_01013600 [Aphelenchoides bicaudatus]